MISFLEYWYLRSPQRALAAFRSVISTVESSFALRDTLLNLDKPLFQDYSREGRIIGILLRIARILIGLITYAITTLLALAVYLFWLIFPLLCIVSVVASFLGSSPGSSSTVWL